MAGKVIPQGPATLPPPGDARRETLSARADVLAEATDTSNAEIEGGSGALPEVESELAQHFNELEVEGALPEYAYSWVYTGQFGRDIRSKQAEGWEVVQGDMTEAKALQGIAADTTRRLGDVILMRTRLERYMRRRKQRESHQRAVEEGVTAELQELGDRYAKYGIIVHTNASPELMKTMASRAAARHMASTQFDSLVRHGNVPGTPAANR